MSPEMNPDGKLTIRASREGRSTARDISVFSVREFEDRGAKGRMGADGINIGDRSTDVVYGYGESSSGNIARMHQAEVDWISGLSSEGPLSRMHRAEHEWLRNYSVASSDDIE